MLRGSLGSISNKASWRDVIEIADEDDNDPVDLSAAEEIELTLRSRLTGSETVVASLTDATITLAADDLSASFAVPRSTMSGFDAGEYEVGLRIVWTDDTDESQEILGSISILEGL